MKHLIPDKPNRTAGTATVRWLAACTFALWLPFTAAAQSVNTLPSGSSAPAPAAAPAKKPAAPPAAKAPAAVPAMPSRHVGEADMDAYLAAVSTAFAIGGRATDPFGQLQDPDAKPIIKPTVAKATRRAPVPQTFPFQDIINMIRVNTVMPKEKRFLIGTRSFRQGERMSLNFRMKNLQVEILAVSARRILFRNVESGETASLQMELLPVGMVPGNSGITAPGMIREQANTPIDLDSTTLPEETNPNR